MAFLVVSRYFPFFVLLFAVFFTFHCEIVGKNPHSYFSFERFEKNRSLDAAIALYGDAEIKDSAVKITRPVGSSSGRVVYRKAVAFLGRNPGFSTYLSFSVSSRGSGEGLVFFLVPISAPLEESTRGLQSGLPPSAIVVKFATFSDPKSGNPGGNHVGIEIGSEASKPSSNLSNVSLVPAGEKLHSWIDYDGDSKRLEVRLSNLNASRPQDPLRISYPVDLSGVLQREEKLAGIGASSGNSTQATSLYSWSFAVKRGAPYLMHSEPLDPQAFFVQARESPPIRPRGTYPWGIFLATVFAVACGGLVTFFVMFVWFALVARRPVAPVEYPVQQPVEVGYRKMELVVRDKGVESADRK